LAAETDEDIIWFRRAESSKLFLHGAPTDNSLSSDVDAKVLGGHREEVVRLFFGFVVRVAVAAGRIKNVLCAHEAARNKEGLSDTNMERWVRLLMKVLEKTICKTL